MKILKLKNEGEYKITEEEALVVTRTWALKGVTSPIFLPRLEIVFTPFQIDIIKPINHQLEYGLPIFIELKDGNMLRAFFDKVNNEYLCDGKLGLELLGKKEEVEKNENYVKFIPEDVFFDNIGAETIKMGRNKAMLMNVVGEQLPSKTHSEVPLETRRYLEAQKD
jgi:hypothetical protein